MTQCSWWMSGARSALCTLWLVGCIGSAGRGSPLEPPPSDDDDSAETVSLGSVSEVGDCESPEETSCQTVRVVCEGLQDLTVDLVVAEPESASSFLGTVVLNSGTGGTIFYNAQTMGNLRTRGFRVVNRRWGEGGWPSGTAGMAGAACRSATLLSWLRDRYVADGPLCATGNSGGSAEIGYVLTHWGGGTLLDAAVLSGGPPLSRLDLGCEAGQEWQDLCAEVVPAEICSDGVLDCDYNAGNHDFIDDAFEGTPCSDGGPADLLLANSLLSEDAVLSYPDTPLHFVFGTADCSSAIPHGYLFAEAVTSTAEIEVASAPHGVFNTPDGRSAIVGALESLCVCRHNDCPPSR